MLKFRVTFHFDGLNKQQVEVQAENATVALVRACKLCRVLTTFEPDTARIVSIGVM